MKLQLDEMETILSKMADDRSKWIITTDDPIMIKKLNKIELGLRISNTAWQYVLDDSQITIRRRRKTLSNENKIKLNGQLSQARNHRQYKKKLDTELIEG